MIQRSFNHKGGATGKRL